MKKNANKITKTTTRTRGAKRPAFDVSKCYAAKTGKAIAGDPPMCLPGIPDVRTTRARMRAKIEKAIARITPGDWMVPPAWFEEIEKRPVADVLADWVFTCNYACMSEADMAQFAVRHMLSRRVLGMSDADARRLVRKFYHAGDCSLEAAIKRATECGVLRSIQKADANADAKTACAARGISFADEPNAVTMRITGKAFENLKRITAVFNAWDENAITPAELLFKYVGKACPAIMNLDTRKPGKYCATVPGGLYGIYGDAHDIGALRKAFERAGFDVKNAV